MAGDISILVIEDEEHIRNILEYNLKSNGFEVFLAEDGLAGLELAGSKKPDAILLDWMMPKVDGLEVLGKLKSNAQTKEIPVFMLTVKKMPSDVGAAILAGAEGYFTKPFDPAKIGPMIRHKLEKLAKTSKIPVAAHFRPKRRKS